MKKRIISILLTVMLITTACYTGLVLPTQAAEYSLNPLYSGENVSVNTTPIALTETEISDFTANVDYTVKSDANATVTFDMPDIKDSYRNVYYNDGTKPLGIKSGSGTITNTDAGTLELKGTGHGQRNLVAENFVDSVTEFELSFDFSINAWGYGQICFGTYANHNTGAHIVLVVNGANVANNSTYNGIALSMTDCTTGQVVGTYINTSGISGALKVTCSGDIFKVYHNGTEIISYIIPAGGLYAGPIYPTTCLYPMAYDNISIDVPTKGIYDPASDSYYEVGLGENVTLGKRINGTYSEIAKSDVALTADTKYNFNIVRSGGNITVTADGSEVLNTTVDFPYTENDVSLWKGFIGIGASADDTIENIAVYDSANLEFANGTAKISPLQTTADNLEITSQGQWDTIWDPDNEKSNATFTDDGKGNFTLSSPSELNSHAVFDGFLNKEYGDVYITFNAINSRANYSYDNIYFAGYNIQFAREATLGAVTVTDPNGTAVDLTGGYTTAFYSDYYKFELLKKGNTVSVYYYPTSATRTLLFTDSNASSGTDFSIKKRQGVLTIKSFSVYDAVPSFNYEIAESVGDAEVTLPDLGENQTIVYKELSGAESLNENSTANRPFLIRYPGNGVNNRLMTYKNYASNQVPPSAEDTLRKYITPYSATAIDSQQWLFIKVESNIEGHTDNAYVIKSASGEYYLGVQPSTSLANQLEVTATPYTFHVEPDTNGYKIYTIDTLGTNKKYLNFTSANGGNGWKLTTTSPSIAIKLYAPEVISSEYTLAKVDFSGVSDEPMDKADTGSDVFRIPALATLKNGWIVAVSDLRWSSFLDSPANIDTICSVSKDGGKTWEWEVFNYFSDFAETSFSTASASFIDPSLTVDSDGNVWLLVNALAQYARRADYTFVGTEARGVDEQGRLLVTYDTSRGELSADASTYAYYLDLNGEGVTATDAWGKAQTVHPICAYEDDAPTGIYADAFLNTYEDSENGIVPILCDQQAAILTKTQCNLFYAASDWRTYPASFLMLRKGTVTENGLEWGLPRYMDFKNEGEISLVVCPGRGVTTTLENGSERIILPVYINPSINSSDTLALSLYSDDGGKTWNRGEKVNDTTFEDGTDALFASESQIVNLPSGNLRMYSRNKCGFISYYDSTDKGITWGECQNSGLAYTWECMVSFINIDGVLVDKNGDIHTDLIMASYPRGSGRNDGTIRIGYMDGTDNVTWANNDDIFYSGQYAYSVLTQHLSSSGIAQNCFSVLYEPHDSLGICVSYDNFTIEDITNNEYTLIQLGDADMDGKVDSIDLSKLRKLLVESETISDSTILDLNKNGKLDIVDLVKLKKLIAGL